MKKMTISTDEVESLEVELVRYFSYDDSYYLIYTLNEHDEKGMIKLYLVEILEELDELVSYNLDDDNEWKDMQAVVKSVIKELKNNKRKKLSDLDSEQIEGIKVYEPRFFKLDSKLVEILASNYGDNVGKVEVGSISKELKLLDNEFLEPIKLPDDEIIETEDGTIIEPQPEELPVETVEPVEVIEEVVTSVEPTEVVEEVQTDVAESMETTELVEEVIETQAEVPSAEPQVEIIDDVYIPMVEQVVSESTEEKAIEMVEEVITPSEPTEVAIENVEPAVPDIEPIEPTVEISSEEAVEPISEPVSEIPVEEVKEMEEQKTEEETTDYKELYLAVKEEKELSDELLDDLLEQLSRYKEKYGELES